MIKDVFVVGVATLFTVLGVLVNCVNCAALGSKGKYSTLGKQVAFAVLRNPGVQYDRHISHQSLYFLT